MYTKNKLAPTSKNVNQMAVYDPSLLCALRTKLFIFPLIDELNGLIRKENVEITNMYTTMITIITFNPSPQKKPALLILTYFLNMCIYIFQYLLETINTFSVEI